MARKVQNKWVKVRLLVEQEFYVEVLTDSRDEMLKVAAERVNEKNILESHEHYRYKHLTDIRMEAAIYALADESRKKIWLLDAN
jgi:hypothetical protein